ncbi:4,5-DOPA dioxygenase extradiol [Tissierella sp.]|uniref:4,5-DOPA-extradiol-dioxygenase n=1 Tax=Tissierella sp. TaxID=41274 RepID=UPI00286441E3|nr:4,5-DOPA dioxygenase extradiol [Tissierella sp.]MDR7855318.1 4,5-DOPA dioxygenase extradiol [Tissierella sp.]
MRFPIGFIGHGSPINIISDNEYTKSIYNICENLPTPKAIVVVTAHWMSDGATAVTTTENPELIYDFYGFPEELYKVKYPCPGFPEIEEILKSSNVKPIDTYGLDHGVWSILKHMYPKADIPVVAMSIDIAQPAEYHYEMGKKLKFLRENDVLVLGSGNIVHNLYLADMYSDPNPYDWAIDFENEVISDLGARNFNHLVEYGDKKTKSIPTKDHYLPLLYILGMVDKDDSLDIIYKGIQNKSISMLSFLFK